MGSLVRRGTALCGRKRNRDQYEEVGKDQPAGKVDLGPVWGD